MMMHIEVRYEFEVLNSHHDGSEDAGAGRHPPSSYKTLRRPAQLFLPSTACLANAAFLCTHTDTACSCPTLQMRNSE